MTKQKIFDAAVKLFSEYSYVGTSMREIAEEVGITVASLYNHYESKLDILYALYDFYSSHWNEKCPSEDYLLSLVDKLQPHEVFAQSDFRFDAEMQDTMNRIVRIALQQIGADLRSEQFVKEHISGRKILSPVLKKMIKTGKIEPLDIEAFCNLITGFSVSAALLNGTTLQFNPKEWEASFSLAFSLVKTK